MLVARAVHFILLGIPAILPLAAQAPQSPLPPAFSAGSLPTSPWFHQTSGFAFRDSVAGFQRGEPHQYNEPGTDISVGYNFYDPRIVATVYVYPTDGLTLDEEFARRQEEITTMYPAAKLVTTDKGRITPKKYEIPRAIYAIPRMFKGMDEPMRSILLVGERGKNFVEYRISYPASAGDAADSAAQRFLDEFAWPDIPRKEVAPWRSKPTPAPTH